MTSSISCRVGQEYDVIIVPIFMVDIRQEYDICRYILLTVGIEVLTVIILSFMNYYGNVCSNYPVTPPTSLPCMSVLFERQRCKLQSGNIFLWKNLIFYKSHFATEMMSSTLRHSKYGRNMRSSMSNGIDKYLYEILEKYLLRNDQLKLFQIRKYLNKYGK